MEEVWRKYGQLQTEQTANNSMDEYGKELVKL